MRARKAADVLTAPRRGLESAEQGRPGKRVLCSDYSHPAPGCPVRLAPKGPSQAPSLSGLSLSTHCPLPAPGQCKPPPRARTGQSRGCPGDEHTSNQPTAPPPERRKPRASPPPPLSPENPETRCGLRPPFQHAHIFKAGYFPCPLGNFKTSL